MWTFNGKYPAPTPLNFYGVPVDRALREQIAARRRRTRRSASTRSPCICTTATRPRRATALPATSSRRRCSRTITTRNAYAGIDDFGGIGDPREGHAHVLVPRPPRSVHGEQQLPRPERHVHRVRQQGSGARASDSGLAAPAGLLRHHRHSADPHRQAVLRRANGRNEVFQVVGGGAPGGDKWVVNGKIQPKLTVRRRKYRFRVLNTGPAKTWNLSLIRPDGTQAPITVVAVDANFTGVAVRPDRPAAQQFGRRCASTSSSTSRRSRPGRSVYLREAAAQNVGVVVADPAPGLPIGNVLMRFDVVNREPWFPPDTPAIPGMLIADAGPRSFPTHRSSGTSRWSADSSSSTGCRSTTTASTTWCSRAAPRNGRWRTTSLPATGRIRCTSTSRRAASCRGGVRVSQNPDVFQDMPLLPEELGRRDVYPLPPQNRVVLRMRFRDFVGRYLIHCHNMNHEDDFMMARWDIVEIQSRSSRASGGRSTSGECSPACRRSTRAWRARLMNRRELFSSSRAAAPACQGARTCGGADLIPNVALRTHDDVPVRFYDDLVKGRQVVINMMYANCEACCPAITSRLVEVHRALAPAWAVICSCTRSRSSRTRTTRRRSSVRRHARRAVAGLDVPDRRSVRHRDAALRAVPAQPHQVRSRTSNVHAGQAAHHQRCDQPLGARRAARQQGDGAAAHLVGGSAEVVSSSGCEENRKLQERDRRAKWRSTAIAR